MAGYGHLVVDERHHLSPASFEKVARRAKAKFVLGLSATVARNDGHHPIIFMQCGPVRFRVDAKSQAAARRFLHRVALRRTDFAAPPGSNGERPPIQRIYAVLAANDARNALIFDDVLRSLEDKRYPLILTERKDDAQQAVPVRAQCHRTDRGNGRRAAVCRKASNGATIEPGAHYMIDPFKRIHLPRSST